MTVLSRESAVSQECSYGEGGLGCRVWGAAHMLSSQLAQSPEIVIDQAVLGTLCSISSLFKRCSSKCRSLRSLSYRVLQSSAPAAVSLA